MTFWDFFHTHPIHSWILITLMITVIHIIVSDIVKVLTFKDLITKEDLSQLKKAAQDLKTRVH